jgi:hypothetical protein
LTSFEFRLFTITRILSIFPFHISITKNGFTGWVSELLY